MEFPKLKLRKNTSFFIVRSYDSITAVYKLRLKNLIEMWKKNVFSLLTLLLISLSRCVNVIVVVVVVVTANSVLLTTFIKKKKQKI